MEHLHPYRQFVIDLFYLENWLFRLASVHRRPAQVDRKQELLDFLNRYAPHDMWEAFYDKYLSNRQANKPTLSEVIHYLHRRGLSQRAICQLVKASPATVKRYLELPLMSRSYSPDPVADELLSIYKPIQIILEESMYQGRI